MKTHGGLALLAFGAMALGFRGQAAPRPDDAKGEAARQFAQAVANEIGVPPFLLTGPGKQPFLPEKLPLITETVQKRYPELSGARSKSKPVLERARVLLWALGGQEPPGDLAEEVKAKRQAVMARLADLPAHFLAVPQEAKLKNEVLDRQKMVAAVLPVLLETIEEVRQLEDDNAGEPLRWQANRDFLKAHLLLLAAHLYEYQSALGDFRKELPPLDPKQHRGWRLESSPQLRGDIEGRKLARAAHQLLEKVAADHAGTPWEVLAKRLADLPIGVEWQPMK